MCWKCGQIPEEIVDKYLDQHGSWDICLECEIYKIVGMFHDEEFKIFFLCRECMVGGVNLPFDAIGMPRYESDMEWYANEYTS